eukprot:scaffold3806_cov94-Isochrysis_galbana.AAC.10
MAVSATPPPSPGIATTRRWVWRWRQLRCQRRLPTAAAAARRRRRRPSGAAGGGGFGPRLGGRRGDGSRRAERDSHVGARGGRGAPERERGLSWLGREREGGESCIRGAHPRTCCAIASACSARGARIAEHKSQAPREDAPGSADAANQIRSAAPIPSQAPSAAPARGMPPPPTGTVLGLPPDHPPSNLPGPVGSAALPFTPPITGPTAALAPAPIEPRSILYANSSSAAESTPAGSHK